MFKGMILLFELIEIDGKQTTNAYWNEEEGLAIQQSFLWNKEPKLL